MKNLMKPLDREMTREETEYFLLGVQKTIADKGLIQRDVALTAGVSPENFSKVLNRRIGSSAKYRRRICEALGVTEAEMVQVGSPVHQNIPQPQQPPTRMFAAPLPADYMAVDDVVQTLSAVSASFIKADARLKFWSQLIESLPIPVLVVRDGLVYVQNRASRAIWLGVGKPLCSGCTDPKCKEQGFCDISEAIETGRDIVRFKKIGDDYFKVSTGHFSANNHSYNVVMITEINECRIDSERLKAIQEERRFLSSNLFETSEVYFNTYGKISYINESFAKLFEIDREDLLTADDLHILLSRKLFYFGNVSKAIDDIREDGNPVEVQAKLKNNKTVYFILTPHIAEEEVCGVLVVCLTAEMYQLFKEAA